MAAGAAIGKKIEQLTKKGIDVEFKGDKWLIIKKMNYFIIIFYLAAARRTAVDLNPELLKSSEINPDVPQLILFYDPATDQAPSY